MGDTQRAEYQEKQLRMAHASKDVDALDPSDVLVAKLTALFGSTAGDDGTNRVLEELDRHVRSGSDKAIDVLLNLAASKPKSDAVEAAEPAGKSDGDGSPGPSKATNTSAANKPTLDAAKVAERMLLSIFCDEEVSVDVKVKLGASCAALAMRAQEHNERLAGVKKKYDRERAEFVSDPLNQGKQFREEPVVGEFHASPAVLYLAARWAHQHDEPKEAGFAERLSNELYIPEDLPPGDKESPRQLVDFGRLVSHSEVVEASKQSGLGIVDGYFRNPHEPAASDVPWVVIHNVNDHWACSIEAADKSRVYVVDTNVKTDSDNRPRDSLFNQATTVWSTLRRLPQDSSIEVVQLGFDAQKHSPNACGPLLVAFLHRLSAAYSEQHEVDPGEFATTHFGQWDSLKPEQQMHVVDGWRARMLVDAYRKVPTG